MLKEKDIIDYYNGLLEYVGYSNVDGKLIVKITNEPETIDGKEIYLPTRENLRVDSNNRIYFHPLGEDVLKGESKVMERLRNMFNTKINVAIQYLMLNLVEVALNPQDLDDEQLSFISKVIVDDNGLKRISTVIKSIIKLEQKDFYAHLYLKKNAKIGDKTYLRGGIFTFPFYKLLDKAVTNDDISTLPIKVTHKDIKMLMSLYEVMFPLIKEPDSYNYGSNNRNFPYLESFIRTVAAVTENINDIVRVFGDRFNDTDNIIFDTNNSTSILDYGKMVNATKIIPMLDGNSGSGLLVEEEQNKNTMSVDIGRSAANNMKQNIPQAQQPTVTQQPINPQYPQQYPTQPVQENQDDVLKRILNNGPYAQQQTPMFQPNPYQPMVNQAQPSPFLTQSNMGVPPNMNVNPNMGMLPVMGMNPNMGMAPVMGVNPAMGMMNNPGMGNVGAVLPNGAILPTPPNPFIRY